MKRSTLKFFVSIAAVMGLVASTSADLLYTFDTSALPAADTGTPGGNTGTFNGGSYAWSSSMQAFQHTGAAGGWNLGGSGPKWEFNYPSQTAMQQYALAPVNSHISFDVIVNDDTWAYADYASTWYQLIYAANSEGVNGSWTQLQFASGNYVDNANAVYHVDKQLGQMGWGPGDTWFQLFFGSNSDGGSPVQFFVDNIHVYYVPEPSTFALAGLGTAALMIFRRRHS